MCHHQSQRYSNEMDSFVPRGKEKKFVSSPRPFTCIILFLLLLLPLLMFADLSSGQQQQQAAAASVVAVANQTSVGRPPNYQETSRQITGILDRFMSLGYDKRVRPNYGGPPVEVNVTMRILSISSVSEVMMDFTADFYFRQTWVDPRLAFKKLGDIETLYVGAEVSKKIWLPDTFFGNEKMAYFHEATTPNVFLRIDHSGEVYRSIRLTVTSSCPMNLQYFPMDRQRCTIEAESYGYNVKDIIYRWARKDTAVERDKEISLPQFDIVKTVQKYRLEELSSGTYSRLIAEIHFARRMGYYLIQIYIPSSLIVVISWVSFWLHRNASPARVQLGVTTVLTMTTLMSSTNAALPKISYVKSIDIFLGTCFIMVFAALLEYATVGYLGKRIAMRKAQVQHAQSQAQARLFAQLQAQGAQGDSIPLTESSAAVAAAAAVATNNLATSNTNVPPIFGPSPLDPSASGVAPSGVGGPEALGINSSLLVSAADVQQAALFNQFANELAHQQHHQLPPPPPPLLDSPQPPERNARGRGGCCDIPRPAGHHHHAGGCMADICQHNQHHHPHHHLHHHQQQQQVCNGCSLHTRSCLKLNAPIASGGCCHCHKALEQPAPSNTCDISSRTLPKNQTFSHYRCHSDQLKHFEAHDEDCCHHQAQAKMAPSKSNLKAGHTHQQMFSEAGRTLPPSYCISGSSNSPRQTMFNQKKTPAGGEGGASAVATAAAATFVNLHRRNKGLPPSTNPNFAKFAWTGQYNRSIETIFGIRPSDIDKYSRVVFPVCFVCFQLMYWIVYLHISAFLESEQQQQQQQLTP